MNSELANKLAKNQEVQQCAICGPCIHTGVGL